MKASFLCQQLNLGDSVQQSSLGSSHLFHIQTGYIRVPLHSFIVWECVHVCLSVCLTTFLLPQDSRIRLGWPQWARDVSTSACLALKVQGMLPCAALYCGPGDWSVVLMMVRRALYLMSFLSRLLLIIFNKGLCSLILYSPCPLSKLCPWSEWPLNWKTHSILSSKWWVGRMDSTQDWDQNELSGFLNTWVGRKETWSQTITSKQANKQNQTTQHERQVRWLSG